MNVELTIAVYQLKASGEITWTTLGLGPFGETLTGRSAVKTQRRLVSKIRKTLRDIDPVELERFQLRRGLRLHRTRLEVVVGEGLAKSRVSGVFPLVAEPRRPSPGQRIFAVYHPMRQDEWVMVADVRDIPEAAQAFFRHAWKGLGVELVEQLRTTGKEVIKPVAFNAEVMGLDHKAAKKKKGPQRRERRESDVLSEIGVNQTSRAIEGTLPQGMPRRAIQKQLWMMMSGRVGYGAADKKGVATKRSAVLIGDPKCGKSTIIARWVADLLEGDDYKTHHNLDRIHKVWRVSGKRLIAGMSHLGDWEQRCLDLLEQVKKTRAVLWVDDIHLWGKLGQSRQSERSFADFFVGPVARGELTLVCECTRAQFARLEDDAPSFASLLSPVRIPPTSPSETLQMMVFVGSQLELDAGVKIHPYSYRAIVEMGASLFPWTAFPGKAIDMLRQLAEPQLGAPPDARTETMIEASDVVQLLSVQTGLPESMLSLDAGLDTEALRRSLDARVMGQPRATEAATDLVCRIRAGLTDPKRPYGVLLFTGPTGTGKTELAKQIAQFLYGDIGRLVRFDMSEYATPDAVPRLIGDRFAPEGLLTTRIREQPFSVLLLDEIEKAHRSVLNLLLQLFGDARLTDAAGNTTSFTHTVIIMTSNLGARPGRPVGFGDPTDKVLGDIAEAVARFFPPELFNRIDRVVPFSPLSPEVAEAVVVKELARLFARRGVKERNIFVYAAAAVKERIVREAFDERWGARTVKRYLEDEVGTLLAEHISASASTAMQVLRLYTMGDTRDGVFAVHADPLAEVEPHDVASTLEHLLDAPPEALREHARDLRKRLAEASENLPARREASREHPALLYYWEWYEERIRTLGASLSVGAGGHQDRRGGYRWARQRQRSQPVHRRQEGREAVLGRISEAEFLLAHVDCLADPEAHAVRLELLAISHGAHPSTGPTSETGRLIDHLLQAYGALTDVTEVAVRTQSGEVVTREDTAVSRVGIQQAVVDVSGFAVSRRLSAEEGCHIRRSAASEPEIVRVRLVDRGPARMAGATPASHLALHETRLAAFDRALERGGNEVATLDNPSRLIPAVRTLSYNHPLRDGAPFGVEVEDFREAYSDTLSVRSLEQVVERIWLLAAGRRP